MAPLQAVPVEILQDHLSLVGHVSAKPAREFLGALFGASLAMQALYDMIRRVAPTEATVFIVGETGTGKELVARTLHDLSSRANKPFLPLNCGALPGSLIESELFGYERGSFTGADHRHAGYFERAEGGTLFLDEVTEMAPDMQTKLLRVLESGSFMRVGGSGEIKTNVRLVAATNRRPEDAVRDGRLREDLYYRLMVFPLHIAPLRERGDDTIVLAQHFLLLLNQANASQKGFSSPAMQILRGYSWPGNVRELKNLVRRAFILFDETLEVDTLLSKTGACAAPADDYLRIPMGIPLAEAERHFISATLDRHAGNKKKAADALGLSLKTLYNRLNVWGRADKSCISHKFR